MQALTIRSNTANNTWPALKLSANCVALQRQSDNHYLRVPDPEANVLFCAAAAAAAAGAESSVGLLSLTGAGSSLG